MNATADPQLDATAATASPATRTAWRDRLAGIALPLLAVTACLGAALLILAALAPAGDEPRTYAQTVAAIATTVWRRALLPGRNYRFWINTLLAATPILLTGLAVATAFRASVLNIGAQGQYMLGAIAAVAVGVNCPASRPIAIIITLGGSMLAGAAIAAIAAVLERWRRVSVVLSTLLLNFVAFELMRSLLQGPMRNRAGLAQSEQILESARLPVLYIDSQRTQLHLGFAIALAAAAFVSFLLHKTTFGFRLRAVGQNPVASRFAGIRVSRVAMIALALSGALAGLAGGIQMTGVIPYQLLLDTGSEGFGFTGIAVALLGRLSATGVVISALFFGLLDTAFAGLKLELGIPSVAAQATQGLILIVMLILTASKRR